MEYFLLKNKRYSERTLNMCWISRKSLEVLWRSISIVETLNTFANSQAKYNEDIHEMLNNNFGFSNVDDSNENATPSG